MSGQGRRSRSATPIGSLARRVAALETARPAQNGIWGRVILAPGQDLDEAIAVQLGAERPDHLIIRQIADPSEPPKRMGA